MVELYLTKQQTTVLFAWISSLQFNDNVTDLLEKFKQKREGSFSLTRDEFILLHDIYMESGQNEYIKNKLEILRQHLK